MSTIVYQNLVSCFESKETTTIVKLKLAAVPPPPANFSDMYTSLEYDNWGSLQTTNPKEPVEKSSSYTHYASSFSRLSPKSLELCTENLGSESGSDVISESSCNDSILEVEVEKPKQEAARNTTKKSKSFPPLLTTMCGPSSLRMSRRREGGRLVINAVEAPFRYSYLQAERSDGRIRLCFSTGSDTMVTTTSGGLADEEEESENECSAELAGSGGKEEFGGEMNCEMGLEKFQRLSRCKEGEQHGTKGLCSVVWKPAFCVAT